MKYKVVMLAYIGDDIIVQDGFNSYEEAEKFMKVIDDGYHYFEVKEYER